MIGCILFGAFAGVIVFIPIIFRGQEAGMLFKANSVRPVVWLVAWGVRDEVEAFPSASG